MSQLPRRALIVSGLATLVAGPALAAGRKGKAPPRPSLLAPALGDMALGAAKAPLTVVEYLSASCPHCARLNNDVFPAIRAKYVDAGKVRWVLREFLTPPEEIAAAGFLLARAAGPGHYYDFLDEIFHRMPEMYSDGTARNAGSVLLSIAGKYGMDAEKAQAVVDDQAANKALMVRVKTAWDLGIRSTPTVLIGATRIEGETTVEAVSAAIDGALKGRRRG